MARKHLALANVCMLRCVIWWRANGLALRKFNGGNRPTFDGGLDRDPQAVKFVEPDVLCRASLSVCEDHGPSDKLRASLLERAEYRRS
jgi:hypothetical protein